MSKKGDIVFRTSLIYVFVFLFAVAIAAKALTVITSMKWKEMDVPGNYEVKPLVLPPNRGNICADDGRVLAVSVPHYEIRFDPVVVKKDIFEKNIDSLAHCLAAFFGDKTKAAYKSMILKAKNRKPYPNRYLLINGNKLDYGELKIVREFPIFRLGRNSGGFQPVVSHTRIQPYVNLASRTIGYINEAKDGTFEGRVGIEKSYEKNLKGEKGAAVKKIMSGHWVTVTEKEPVEGNDVITTINVDFQDIVQTALARAMKFYEAESGTAILMEVKTGNIKAIANLGKVVPGVYAERKNYAISDAAEPGSVFKACVYICLMEDGFYSVNDTVDLGNTGVYTFKGHSYRESHGSLGRTSVKRMFEESSNGVTRLVYDAYKDNPRKFIKRMKDMGVSEKLDIVLEGEAVPYMENPDSRTWSGLSLPSLAIGYSVKMTPLQILSFYNAIANNGQRMRPCFVTAVKNKGETIRRFEPEKAGKRICSEKTLAQMREMLEGVVENGTGKKLRNPYCKIAGKTGTARLALPGRGYADNKYVASFVGYFPADEPVYSCIVMVNSPSNSKGYYAASVAVPVFKEISDKVYAMSLRDCKSDCISGKIGSPVFKNGYWDDVKRILKEFDMDYEVTGGDRPSRWVKASNGDTLKVSAKHLSTDDSVVPDVRGMGLRDALYILESRGLEVGISGAGSVRSQSLAPGTRFKKGNYIQIELR